MEEGYYIDLKFNLFFFVNLCCVVMKCVIDNLIENVFCYGFDNIVIMSFYDCYKKCIYCKVWDFGLGILLEELSSVFMLFV